MNRMHYGRLLPMAVLSFVSMYALMYAMVDAFANVYLNLNQVYMAGLMTAPMVVIELVLMRAMYADRRMNVAITAVTVVVLGVCWMFIRDRLRLRTGNSCAR